MAIHTTVHVFVEVSKTDHRKIEFDTDQATARQIKEKAKLSSETDLARREPGKDLELISDDQTITLKNGEHFVSLPAGTIS